MPSYRECVIHWGCVCVVVSMSAARLLKTVAGLWPKYAHMMGQRPPFDVCKS